LFKRKRKHIKVFHNDDIVWDGRLENLPIKDSTIVEKSILFFNDSEPCFIHKNAVIHRILFEIEDAFSLGSPIDKLTCLNYLSFDKPTSIIIYKK